MTRNVFKVLMDLTGPPRDNVPAETKRDSQSGHAEVDRILGLVPLRSSDFMKQRTITGVTCRERQLSPEAVWCLVVSDLTNHNHRARTR